MGVGCRGSAPVLNKEIEMAQYFKKPNGVIIEAHENHDLASLKDRFEECDANGKALKKAPKKKAKKGDK